MHHLAVGTLAAQQKRERIPCESEITHAVDGVERVKRVAAEVPSEAGAR